VGRCFEEAQGKGGWCGEMLLKRFKAENALHAFLKEALDCGHQVMLQAAIKQLEEEIRDE
jgi:hypothetical protein